MFEGHATFTVKMGIPNLLAECQIVHIFILTAHSSRFFRRLSCIDVGHQHLGSEEIHVRRSGLDVGNEHLASEDLRLVVAPASMLTIILLTGEDERLPL